MWVTQQLRERGIGVAGCSGWGRGGGRMCHIRRVSSWTSKCQWENTGISSLDWQLAWKGCKVSGGRPDIQEVWEMWTLCQVVQEENGSSTIPSLWSGTGCVSCDPSPAIKVRVRKMDDTEYMELMAVADRNSSVGSRPGTSQRAEDACEVIIKLHALNISV